MGLAYEDIRKKAISIKLLISALSAFILAGIIDYVVCKTAFDWKDKFMALVIVALLMVVSISTNMIGMADVLIIACLCIVMDVKRAAACMFISFFLTAVIGVTLMVLKKVKRNTSLPYIPFLFVAYILTEVLAIIL